MDFDARGHVFGPFGDSGSAVASVVDWVAREAETAVHERLVAHSHSIVDVSDGGDQFVASVLGCFDTDSVDHAGEKECLFLDLGPYDTVREVNDAVAGQVAMSGYLLFERNGLAITGVSHDVVVRSDERGAKKFHATAVMVARGAGSVERTRSDTTLEESVTRPPGRRRLRVAFPRPRAHRSAQYRRPQG